MAVERRVVAVVVAGVAAVLRWWRLLAALAAWKLRVRRRQAFTTYGRRCDEDDDRPLSPTSRGHQARGNFPWRFPRFCFLRTPRARPGGPGMTWARRMDVSPNPGENENPGTRLSHLSPSGWKKGLPGASSETAGDALSYKPTSSMRSSKGSNIGIWFAPWLGNRACKTSYL
jgi:hypothetical protein